MVTVSEGATTDANLIPHGLSRNSLVWLLVAQGVVVLPLIWQLPLWLWLVWLLAIVIRVQIYRGLWPFPRALIKGGLGGICLVGLLWSYAGNIGVEPAVGLLICAFILKVIELRQRRDALLVVYIGFIAVANQFLFSQTLTTTAYALFCCIMLLSALRSMFKIHQHPVLTELKSAAQLLLQTVPLMIVLFLVLPRVGPLWSVPLMQDRATTGFSDTMSPGDFSELVKSNALAFRVTFADEKPDMSQLYWRGLVLNNYDGRRWHRISAPLKKTDLDQWSKSPVAPWQDVQLNHPSSLTYTVMLEPHQRHWLFALMMPERSLTTKQNLGFASDFLLLSKNRVVQRMQYQVVSHLDYRITELSAERRTAALRLPSLRNSRAQKLGEKWRRDIASPEAIVRKALSLFNTDFTYTLRPPPLGTDSVDEFLFITKRGFCEHFSSSFVFLMRAAGIPARVVVGYQGGEWNAANKYLMVRQSDAHAWAEVWLEDSGWTRVDPTAAVSPLRIEQGLSQALPSSERSEIRGFVFNRFNWISTLALQWDALGYHWHRWVLGYDNSRQRQFFKQLLGDVSGWKVGLFLVIVSGVCLGLVSLWLFWHRAVQTTAPEIRLYKQFSRKLARYGVTRNLGESPSEFAARLGVSYPYKAKQVAEITALFQAIAYEGKRELLPELKSKIELLIRARFNTT